MVNHITAPAQVICHCYLCSGGASAQKLAALGIDPLCARKLRGCDRAARPIRRRCKKHSLLSLTMVKHGKDVLVTFCYYAQGIATYRLVNGRAELVLSERDWEVSPSHVPHDIEAYCVEWVQEAARRMTGKAIV